MLLEFAGEVWHWRGPAPYHFVSVPPDEAADIAAVAPSLSYGWGMVPATVRIGTSEWTTALWPKDESYVVPLKAWVRRAEQIDLGDVVEVGLRLEV